MRVEIVATPEEGSRWVRTRLFEVHGLRPSLRRLARESGLSQTTLGSVVRGVSVPSAATTVKLAHILKTDVLEVRRRTGLVPLIAIDSNLPLPPISEDVRQLYTGILHSAIERLSNAEIS